ncbi:MAG TPA: argininosuccinate synthase [Acidimicrobiales bacterium]|nr:argininosuccinate synthase [Acidimicrobiales bacterium]
MSNGTVIVAFSGGLDTSFCVVDLAEQGWRVLTATVNTGGFDGSDLERIAARSAELGAAEHVVVDMRRRLYDEFVSYVLKANYLRNGLYPSCVGVERMIQAEAVTLLALERQATAICHGSTGAGNDHVRFDAVIRALAPRLEILAPIRDHRQTRDDEAAFLRKRGFEVSEKVEKYSVNQGMLGTTIGGEETYGSWDYLPEGAWPWTSSPDSAPDGGIELVVGFEQGLPVGLAVAEASGTTEAVEPVEASPEEGETGEGYAILLHLNRLGARHGVGRGIHLGQTIMGISARVAFEAPGMIALITAHKELERLVLSNRQQSIKATLGQVFGDLLHEAIYYDPVLDDLRALLDSSQRHVSGEVRLKLHKGAAYCLGARSQHSLLDSTRRLGATYGYGSGLWSGEDAKSFARIYATAGLVARQAAEGPQEPG